MTVISMIPNDTPYLPAKVTEVPKDVLRNFPHSKKVGNYLLGNTLGEGSFAKVKEALHIPTGERVAVKIIDKKKSREDSYVRKNLRREGKILQMIRHKNIVQLLEIMETQNSYYLVTELCRGGDLMDYISQRRRLPETEVKKYIRQIVSAVDYLHRLGILHRDLKIENLLLDEYRDMKIIDFGLSNCIKIMHTKDGPRTQEFCVTQCGSPAYAAPELLGRQKYGPQVDVWSIGVNMYAMLTGNLPFTVEPFNIKTLHSKMVNGQMNPLPENISKECREVLKKFLTADPDRRITLEDTLKHPWIADGPTTPMPRASCPNKLKTEALDNSILKHMSENQGFRIGEIIRYVTGNVPSSATAMYHLMLRKFTKHIGNVKVTGKTQADHRILQRTQNKNTLIKVRQDITMDKTNHQLNQSDNKPAINHIVNTVRHVVTKTTDPEPSLEGEHSNRLKDQNEHNSRVSGHQTWNRRRLKYKYGEDETFTDLLQQKATDVNTPRAYLPVKPRSDYSSNNNQVPNCLPNVAQKYVKRIKTVNTLDTTEARTRTPTSGMEIRRDSRLSGSESQDHDDGQFRQRASTFPGKTQRPKIVINKLSREKQTDQTNCIKGTSDQSKDNPRETVSPTPEPSKVKINNLVTAPGSPRTRRNYLHHSENVSGANSQSNTPRSNQYMFYTRKFHQRRAMNVTHLQASKERDAKHEEESGGYLSKHVLSRPTRNNRIPRVTLGIKGRDEPIVVENFAELSSTGSRALSSRNTNLSGTSTNRSITPGLPSLNPSFTEGGKQNS